MVFDSEDWHSFSQAQIRPFDSQLEFCDYSFLECKSNSDGKSSSQPLALDRSKPRMDLSSPGPVPNASSPPLLAPTSVSTTSLDVDWVFPQVERIEATSSCNNSMVSPTLIESSTIELGNSKDDIALRIPTSRNIDYLSHVWEEDEIFSSWRHLMSERGAHCDSMRLENACWRSWAKLKNSLKTTSPESLNW